MPKTLEVTGATLSYDEFGEGPETIVFVHGGGGNHLSWWNQIPHFMDRYRCVTFSTRGFGFTLDHSNEGPSAYARDLGELMDGLGIERAVLVGQSLGGFTVLPFAARNPERAAGVLMADTVIGVGNEEILAELQTQLATARNALDDRGANIMVGPEYEQQSPEGLFLYNTIRALNPPLQVGSTLSSTDGAATNEEMANLSIPVVFLVGAEDRLVPPPVVEQASRLLPNSRYVEVPRGGHSVYWELPNEFNAILEDLLNAAYG
ncbi:MAG: alpha/beta hydrolase [Chloroflexi bacterium]|nr:alpha/beta hydrolase [Chloroflexota bacterium]